MSSLDVSCQMLSSDSTSFFHLMDVKDIKGRTDFYLCGIMSPQLAQAWIIVLCCLASPETFFFQLQ